MGLAKEVPMRMQKLSPSFKIIAILKSGHKVREAGWLLHTGEAQVKK
jgi:hypothetical protein